MATSASSMKLSGLARRLVVDGLLDEQTAIGAQDEAQKKRVPLVTHLVDSKKVDSRVVAVAASSEFGVPVFDLNCLDAEAIPKDLIPEKLVRQHQALPLIKRGNRLFVAVSDPMNIAALDEIKFNTGIATEPVLVEQNRLTKLIDDVLSAADSVLGDIDLDDDLDNLEITSEQDNTSADQGDSEVDDTPVVRFVNKVMLDAINKKASDIHFEPYEKQYRVRLRIDVTALNRGCLVSSSFLPALRNSPSAPKDSAACAF